MSGNAKAGVFLRQLAGLTRLQGGAWATLVVLLLGAMLAARVGQLGLSLRPTGARADSGIAALDSEALAAQARNQSAIQQRDHVLAAHLFGTAAPEATLSPAPVQWVLSGIIQGSTPQSGLAILGENAQSTHLRAVGQEVFGGFRLVQVLADQVTLEGAGQRLALRLSKTRLAALAAAGEPTALGVASPTALAPGIWHPAKGLIGVPLPAQALLRPQAHHDADGKYDGLQVMNLDSRLSPLGLQRADVITEIDGRAITSANMAQQALQQLSSGTTVMVTVERQGSPMQLPLTISENGGS
jgi:type II secretory pathway component PulC